MFYVFPRVTLVSTGAVPPAAEAEHAALGCTWQRFSRHLVPGAWLPGDDLCTWLAAVRKLLLIDAGQAA